MPDDDDALVIDCVIVAMIDISSVSAPLLPPIVQAQLTDSTREDTTEISRAKQKV